MTRVLALVALAVAIAAAPAAGTPVDCGRYGVVCSHVKVPVDWTGKLHGTVSLEVKVARAEHPRGVMFLLAGGPGQASAEAFVLAEGAGWKELFPDYTLVAFDPRGTGGSGRIRCASDTHGTVAVAACARKLGPVRDFYSTADNARDLDAVRQALGFERIGVLGVSYGTDVALTYARMFPDHVERLLLDSVATPITALPLVRGVLHALPRTLTRYCERTCAGVTTDYGRDAVRLANALETRPLHGRVLRPHGGTRLVTLGAKKLLGLLISTDLDSGLAAEMPAAVQAALHHDQLPLLRLADLVEPVVNPSKILGAVYVATTCDDGPLPWPPGTSVARRRALLKSAEGTVPGLAGRFGPWAAALGNADVCFGWPDSAAPPSPPARRYPNVPMLTLSGDLDLRSPTFEARAAVAHFPRGHLLTVANAGHSVLPSFGSACIRSAVRRWLAGGTVPHACTIPTPLAPLGPFPSASAPADRLALVADTLREAGATSLLAGDEDLSTVSGLAGGTLHGNGDIDHYSLGRGVAVSGHLEQFSGFGRAVSFRGIFRVEQGGRTIGQLVLNADGLEGVLDGARVVAGKLAPLPPPASGAPWSDWAPPQGAVESVAKAIAAQIGSRYLIAAGGGPLVDVKQGPPRAPDGRPAAAIDVSRFLGSQYSLASTAWTYTLCGASAHCAIPGEPSETRFRVAAREALELALYTFEYLPSIETVLVYLPPPEGTGVSIHALYFERRLLTRELSRPLVKTLPLAVPPVSTDADPKEAATIDRLTVSRVFRFRFPTARIGPIVYLTPA